MASQLPDDILEAIVLLADDAQTIATLRLANVGLHRLATAAVTTLAPRSLPPNTEYSISHR
jgi:hypothetical protein